MSNSIIDDFSYIKKKMEEIRQEESAVNDHPENMQPQPQPKPLAPVWSTGMKGSGIGYNEACHHDGVALTSISHPNWVDLVELPSNWAVRMQQYQETLVFCRKHLDKLCGVYLAKDKDNEGTAFANPAISQGNEVRGID